MKIFMTERAKLLIDTFSAEESQRLFEDLRDHAKENPSTYKEPVSTLGTRSGLDIRVIPNHPLIPEPFIKLDTKMDEHLTEKSTNARMIAFFRTNRARNEDIDETLIPLEFD